MNTVGSYICSCREGFVLQKDKHSCKEGNSFYTTFVFLHVDIIIVVCLQHEEFAISKDLSHGVLSYFGNVNITFELNQTRK